MGFRHSTLQIGKPTETPYYIYDSPYDCVINQLKDQIYNPNFMTNNHAGARMVSRRVQNCLICSKIQVAAIQIT